MRSADRAPGAVPLVTVALVAANALAFVAAGFAGAGWLAPDPGALVRLGANWSPATLAGEWWRLVANVFLHFGVAHLALNLWALAVVGPPVERAYGRLGFLLVYLAAGVAGSVASLWWHPVVNSAGASGAIFGSFGALLATLLAARDDAPPQARRRLLTNVAAIAAVSLAAGLLLPGVDNAAHLGGFGAGLALGGLLGGRPAAARLLDAVAVVAVCLAAVAVALRDEAFVPRGGPVHWSPAGPVSLPTRAAPAPVGAPAFAGLRLGTSVAEVFAAKGEPGARWRSAWVYAVDPRGAAPLDVLFDREGRVVAVFQSGPAEFRPPEAPAIRTYEDVARVARELGPPVIDVRRPDGQWYVRFANGVAAGGGPGGRDPYVGLDARR